MRVTVRVQVKRTEERESIEVYIYIKEGGKREREETC
jgi:hypothetical protein